jgi:hypothetical protein
VASASELLPKTPCLLSFWPALSLPTPIHRLRQQFPAAMPLRHFRCSARQVNAQFKEAVIDHVRMAGSAWKYGADAITLYVEVAADAPDFSQRLSTRRRNDLVQSGLSGRG